MTSDPAGGMMAPTDKDPETYAPLSRFRGERPPAPPWFKRALARAPERTFVDVEDAPVELLTWGERGLPGLLFVHGGRAHADWWTFIAPFFAQTHRVAAISLTGMGRSGWRDAYDVRQFTREMIACAAAAGLFEPIAAPIVVCHSFGSRPTFLAAASADVRLRAAIILDAAISAPSAPEIDFSEPRPNKVYPTLEAALARFRLMPVQACDNTYLLDHIARHSLKSVPQDGDGEAGWTWRFDPFLLQKIAPGTRKAADAALRGARCPLAFVVGERSAIVREANLAYTRSISPPGTLFISVPEAAHHLFLDQPIALVTAVRTLLAGWD